MRKPNVTLLVCTLGLIGNGAALHFGALGPQAAIGIAMLFAVFGGISMIGR